MSQGPYIARFNAALVEVVHARCPGRRARGRVAHVDRGGAGQGRLRLREAAVVAEGGEFLGSPLVRLFVPLVILPLRLSLVLPR